MGAAKIAKKPKDKNAPKRPMSAFMLFSNDMRPKIQAELGTKDFSEVAKKMGELWQNISESDKARYDAKNEKAKAKYAKTLAKYKKSKQCAEYEQKVAEWKQAVKNAKKAAKLEAAPKKVVKRKK